MSSIDALRAALTSALGARIGGETVDRGQLTIEASATGFAEVATVLRDDESLAFTEMVDLVGIDYQGYQGWNGARYAVLYILLSIKHNWRVRVRVMCPRRRLSLGRVDHHRVARRLVVRARGLRSLRHRLPGPSRPAAHPHRLRLHGASVPQGISRSPDTSRCATTPSSAA
jgi:hypothetical protein